MDWGWLDIGVQLLGEAEVSVQGMTTARVTGSFSRPLRPVFRPRAVFYLFKRGFAPLSPSWIFTPGLILLVFISIPKSFLGPRTATTKCQDKHFFQSIVPCRTVKVSFERASTAWYCKVEGAVSYRKDRFRGRPFGSLSGFSSL